MVVGWAVVRSLAGFPDAGPTGHDYLGGACLLWLARLVVRTVGYVDGVRFDYVDIGPADAIESLIAPDSVSGSVSDSLLIRRGASLGAC
jgi:hypothetical protein